MNFQRPGAITNATMEEFRDSVQVSGSYVMRVKRHKTMREGPAQVVIRGNDHEAIQKYIQRVRSKHETASCDCKYLNILSLGRLFSLSCPILQVVVK